MLITKYSRRMVYLPARLNISFSYRYFEASKTPAVTVRLSPISGPLHKSYVRISIVMGAVFPKITTHRIRHLIRRDYRSFQARPLVDRIALIRDELGLASVRALDQFRSMRLGCFDGTSSRITYVC